MRKMASKCNLESNKQKTAVMRGVYATDTACEKIGQTGKRMDSKNAGQ